MKVNIFIFLFLFISCIKSSPKTANSANVSLTHVKSDPISGIVDSITTFKEFIALFKQVSVPIKTEVLNNERYLIEPFSKNIKYMNGLAIVDFQKGPTNHVPCFYHNNCSTFLPPNLKDYYDDSSLATKFCGFELLPRKENFIILLCKGRARDGNQDDIYLLVFSKDGSFLSGIQTDAVCGNKVATIYRSSTINQDWSILIQEHQEFANKMECSANKGFEVYYVYKIDSNGKIVKKSESIKAF